MKTVEFSSLLNLNNHKMVVEDSKGKRWPLERYHACPRAEYLELLDPKNPGVINLKTVGIKHMPMVQKRFNYVISRETLRAQKVLEKRILSHQGLKEFLDGKGLSDKDFIEKIKYISPSNLETRWPDFYNWIKSQPEDSFFGPDVFYKNIKKYVGRNDLYAPGPKGRDDNNEVTHCRGLIQKIDADTYL